MSLKKSKTETALVTVAESVGSALGSLVATATRAKNALAPKELAGRQAKRKMKGALRRVSAKTVKTAKGAYKAGGRTSNKIRKAIRRARKDRE